MICPSCGGENPDGFAFCGHCGVALGSGAAREVRKTVTVLFADVVGSTAAGETRDPERVRAEMARWFEQARATIERHGGRVEKFAGDAVMAVFGIPRAHEDDALRAVRAAEELRRDTLRIGVNTGEVVAGVGDTLVTGDAVNVAARLEQAAAPGEVLVGSETRQLVRDAAKVEPLTPLELKGKAAPVEAYRLLSIHANAEAIARRLDTPLVGRRRELEMLRQAFQRAVSERSCQLFTLLGPAGVGKSRLVLEFLADIPARVLRGRCLHYGEGITYYPVVEVLMQLGADPEQIIASSPAEAQLSFRKLLEQEAAHQPFVVVIDDLQWGEPTFLDLVEHVADLSRGAPIFLLCLARPDLLDVRPAWGGGKLNAATMLLEPLQPQECEQLIDSLGSADEQMRARIVIASEGNPLFLEEMLAILREEGDVAVPPTIHALLQARLDTLGQDERSVVERGAVEGEVFHRGAVLELAPEADVDMQLPALVRKEFIRPHTPLLPDDDAYRFRHLLIRDAAYESLPKETRAGLHERFAVWLDEHAQLVEQDEIVGYHLEQAAHYRRDLGTPDERLDRLASERLGAAGRRALGRSDYAAGINLLERATGLLPRGDDQRVSLLPELGFALIDTARFDDVSRCAEEAAESPEPRWQAYAVLLTGLVEAMRGSQSVDDLGAVIAQSKSAFAQLGEELGLARTIYWDGQLEWTRCRARAAADAYRLALAHAEPAGDRRLVQECLARRARTFVHSPTHVQEARRELEALLEQTQGLLLVQGHTKRSLGQLAAARGDFESASAYFVPGREALREAGLVVEHAGAAQSAAFIERMAGDFKAEERELRAGLARLDELGERSYASTTAMQLADCLRRQERDDEASALVREVRERSVEGDLVNVLGADATEAHLRARRGENDEAERLALRAVEVAETTDFWDVRGDCLEALAAVHAASGRTAQARAAYERAVAVYFEKGATVPAERVRELVAEL
jgi:class 3 adenylate cyclase/tetratricopeptide (TPR) repeat protein